MRKIIKYIGWALVAYGASAPILSKFIPMDTSPEWWMQVVGTILGGVGLTQASGWKFKLPNFGNVLDKINAKTPDVIFPKDSTEHIPELPKDEFLDMRFLHYLAERFRDKDPEALKLCLDLSVKLFELHHGKKADTSNNSSPVI